MMIRFTRDGRLLYVKACQHLIGKQKEKFTKEVKALYDEKITGDIQYRIFDITSEDITTILIEKCGVKRPQLIK